MKRLTALTLSILLLFSVCSVQAAENDPENTAASAGSGEAAELQPGEETEGFEAEETAVEKAVDTDSIYYGTGLIRLETPGSLNPYYFSNLNIFRACGYGLPNCTAYAWGRSYEYYGVRPSLSTGNAGEWWYDNISWGMYEFGQEPRVGAVAVWDRWDQNRGHVAFVEAVNGDTVTISQSAYQSTLFYTAQMKADGSNYMSGGVYRFLGYIYVDQPYTGRSFVSGDCWEVRKGQTAYYQPSASASGWVTVPAGARIQITEYMQEDETLWGKFYTSGRTLWVILNQSVCISDPSLTPVPPVTYYDVPVRRVVTTAGAGVNLREGYGTQYSRILWIPDCTELEVTAVAYALDYSWAQVTYNGYTGWVVNEFLTDYTAPGPEPVRSEPSEEDGRAIPAESIQEAEPVGSDVLEIRQVNTPSGLRVRAQAGTGYEQIGYLPNGTQIEVLEKWIGSDYTWIRIRSGELTGWCANSYTRFVRTVQCAETAEEIPAEEMPVPSEDPARVQPLPQTPAAEPVSYGLLKAGAISAEVELLQNTLNALGYDCGIADGIFGARTTAAVKAFQSAQMLSADGIVGPKTWSALEAVQKTAPQVQDEAGEDVQEQTQTDPAPKTPVQPEEEPQSPADTRPEEDPVLYIGIRGQEAAVKRLQERLLLLGFNGGAPDGQFGALTNDAVVHFQISRGLVPDGIVGARTWAALYEIGTGSAPAADDLIAEEIPAETVEETAEEITEEIAEDAAAEVVEEAEPAPDALPAVQSVLTQETPAQEVCAEEVTE